MSLIFALVIGLVSHAGFDNGNAGDAFASEFILTGRDLAQRFDLLGAQQIAPLDLQKLRSVLKGTEVVSEDQVFLNGHERDAVNHYPDRALIRLSRARWRELRKPSETKARLRLVLHEYIWMTGIDDRTYELSDRLIELLVIKNYSPNVWWNPVNPINSIALRAVDAPADCVLASLKSNLKLHSESLESETTGACGAFHRRVTVRKFAGVTPGDSGIHGLFHVYEVRIYQGNQLLSEFSFEPDWGSCLLPDGSCQASGKFTVAGVQIIFWLLRE